MKQYRAVVFDWDGTVMDSTHAIVTAIQLASADLGLPVPSGAIASWVIGLSLEAALYRVVPDLNAEQMPDFIERYRHHFFQRDLQLKLFDGMQNMMDELKERDVLLAVATGKSRPGLDRLLVNVGLDKYFYATRCADETQSKPHPQMLHELLEEMQLPVEQVIMVGDTTHDVHMAQNAGMDSLAVSYGAHDPDTLSKATPTFQVDKVAAMRDVLLARV